MQNCPRWRSSPQECLSQWDQPCLQTIRQMQPVARKTILAKPRPVGKAQAASQPYEQILAVTRSSSSGSLLARSFLIADCYVAECQAPPATNPLPLFL